MPESAPPEEELTARQTVLRWGRGPILEPSIDSLGRLLSNALARQADAPALVGTDPQSGGRVALTYRELDRAIERQKHQFSQLGVHSGDRVGIGVDRQVELVVAVLALWRLGAGYIPLDPRGPDQRWAQLIGSAGLRFVVGSATTLEARAPGLRGVQSVIWVSAQDEDRFSGTPPEHRQPVSRNDPDAAAYVLFTSGTTGEPKGVVVSHRNLLYRIESYRRWHEQPHRSLVHTSMAFDAALPGLVVTLATGGCVVLATDTQAYDPGRSAELIAAEEITYIEAVPSWYQVLLDVADLDQVRSLRIAILGAEVLSPSLVGQHYQALPEALLVNDYGPTETTIAVAAYEVPPIWSGDRVPIGSPHPNSLLYVVNEHDRLVAPGEVGELLIGGPGVAQGYLGDPTSPRFGPNPFGSGRVYRSGDLARWVDGNLDLLGRQDRQVQIRGQRVEPEETEAALGAIEELGQVAVEVDQLTGSPRLIAYVTPRPGRTLTPEAVSRYAEQTLPPALRPELVHVLASMPQTIGGKIDRQALSSLQTEVATTLGGPPRGSSEHHIAQAFAEVLGLAEVGRLVNFHELGGDSLAAARVVARLRRSLGRKVEVGDLRAAPTPAQLATYLSDRPPEAQLEPNLSFSERKENGSGRGPASPQQELFWVLEHNPGMAGSLNLVEVVRLPGVVDRGRLEHAWSELAARHESLRTSLRFDGQELEQIIEPAEGFSGLVVPLNPQVPIVEEAQRFGAEPFDLGQAPLARLGVVAHRECTELVVVVHHAVADGWGIALIVRDLLAEIEREPTSRSHAGPRWQPLDVAEWVQARAKAEAAEALETLRPTLELAVETNSEVLPYDAPVRSAATDRPVTTLHRQLPKTLVQRLETASGDVGTSLYRGLISTFGLLLRAFGAPERFVISVPVANRDLPEFEEIVGCFIQTHPLVVDVTGNPSFRDVAQRIDTTLDGHAAHQWVPYQQILNHLPGLREQPPPVLFNLLNFDQQTPSFNGETVLRYDVPLPGAHADLDLQLEPTDEGLRVTLRFRHDALEEPTVDRLFTTWQKVIEECVAHPDQPLWSLESTLPDAQELRALEGDPGPKPHGTTMDLIAQHWAAGSQDPALIDGEGQLTWDELRDQTVRVAAGLLDLGIQKGHSVVVAADGSRHAILALLACWWLGAVPVPVGERQAAARVRSIAARTGARVVLDPVRTAELAQTALIDLPRTPLAATDQAYILFTSGSTGTPKGVLVSHGALLASTQARFAAYPEAPSRTLVAHDLAFDAALGIIAWYLARGGTLVVAPHEERLDPERLATLIATHSVGQVDLVPSHLEFLLNSGPVEQLRTLRLITTGAETCPPQLVARHNEVLPDVRLVNEYGPTECTVWTVAHDCSPEDTLAPRVPIGRPVLGTRARVVDEANRPRPVGSPGELLLSGHLLAEGYLDDEQQTAHHFVELDGERWYRTGDQVRWNNRGELEFLGRNDDQIKIRGLRIELGEVERALMDHPDVRQAVVDVREIVARSPVLVAWTQTTATVSAQDLAAHCQRRLPAWMVPSTFVAVDAIPLTTSGKVNRGALEVPSHSRAETVFDSLEGPSTEWEKLVAGVWEELLGRPVGVDEDFFAAGGQSLLAARMAVQIRQRSHRRLTLQQVLVNPTIRAIAEAVDHAESAVSGRGQLAIPIEPIDSPREWPLAPHQTRLWYIAQLQSTADPYHVVSVGHLTGPLRADALAAAVAALGEHHPWLRSTIRPGSDGPVQIEHPQPLVALDHAPARSLADAEQWAHQFAHQPFALDRVPPWRIGLCRVDEHSHVLALAAHHIVCDAQSIDVMLEELAAGYNASLSGEAPVASNAAHPGVVAQELIRRQAGPFTDQRVAEWAESLRHCDLSARVPPGLDRAGSTGDVIAVERRLEHKLWARLESVAASLATTPFAVAASVVGAVTARAMGVSDVALGFPVDLRWALPESDTTVAFLVETGIVGLADPAGVPLAQSARAAHQRITAMVSDPVPFDRLVAELRQRSALTTQDDPIHTYVGWLEDDRTPADGSSTLGPAGPTMEPLRVPRRPIADMNWTFIASESGLGVTVEVDPGRLGRAAAERLMDQLLHLFDLMLDDPTRPLTDREVLPAAQQTEVEPHEGRLVAEPRPDFLSPFLALVAERRPLLRQLKAQARPEELEAAPFLDRVDQAAAALMDRGVKPGDAVAVASERSLGMVVAFLAVLRAGATVVPLDAAHPLERRHLIAELVNARAIIGTEAWIEEFACRLDLPALRLSPDGQPPLAHPAPARWPERNPDSVAYVMFTSGSTGQPKGVAVPDRALRARLDSYREVLDPSPPRFLQQSALGFDASIFMLWVLEAGGTLVIPPDAVTSDPMAIGQIINAEQIDTVFMVPSVYRLVLEDAPRDGLRSLRWALIGGEEVTPSLVAAHRDAVPEGGLMNVYGPTETVTTAVAATVENPGPVVPIGRPHPGTVVRVVDRHLRRVGIGAPGELLVGGPCVAAGYHGRPDLTDAVFLNGLPAGGPRDSTRWYRTGDQVYWTETGELVFVGRIDRQVKLRGQRIELGEVEQALLALPDVADAVVDVLGEGPSARLVAAITPPPLTGEKVRSELAEILPRGWVPQVVLGLDSIPRTLGGKPDRRVLAELVEAAGSRPGPPPSGEVAAPFNPTVSVISDAMGQLLEIDDVGPDDDFFDLGGHSLLAARLVAMLAEALGTTIALAALVEEATPRRLAQVAEAQMADGWATSAAQAEVTIIRAEGAKAPLVIVARDGETSLYMRHLLADLDPDRPLWLVLRPMPSVRERRSNLVEQGRQVAAALAATGATKVHLVAHSASGLVAMQAAQDLGGGVGSVVLLDTVAPLTGPQKLAYRLHRIRRWFTHTYRELGGVRWRYRVRTAARGGDADPGVIRVVRDHQDERGDLGVRPQVYQGRVVLLTATETIDESGWDLGWSRWCPDLSIRELTGDHLGILLPPQVAATVRAIDTALTDQT